MTKLYDILRKYVFWLLILGVCGVYVLTGFLELEKTYNDLLEILCDGALLTVLGILINGLMGGEGIDLGLRSDEVRNATDQMTMAYTNIELYENYLGIFCDYVNNKILERRQRKWCKYAHIDYEEFVKGNYEIPSKLKTLLPTQIKNKRLRKGLIKANKVEGGDYTTEWLICYISTSNDKNPKRANIAKYSTLKTTKGVISKVFISAIGAYYTLSQVDNFSLSAILWKLFMVCILIMFGIARLFSDYNYITHNYKADIVDRRDMFVKFNNSLTQQPELYENKIKIKEKEVVDNEHIGRLQEN